MMRDHRCCCCNNKSCSLLFVRSRVSSDGLALQILRALLDEPQVSLQLMEASQICRPLAEMQAQHTSAAVAQAAAVVATRWREKADAIVAALLSHHAAAS